MSNFSKHLLGIDSRLMPRYPCTVCSLLLSILGMAITLALFHALGKHPSRKHLLKRVVQNVGSIMCILFTITLSMPSDPGHFLSCNFLITSSTSWFLKFGTAWEAWGFEPATCALMLCCCTLSCAMWSWGRICGGGRLLFPLLLLRPTRPGGLVRWGLVAL